MIRLFATDENGKREEITDLYWFEENGVHDFGGEGHFHKYHIELVWTQDQALAEGGYPP